MHSVIEIEEKAAPVVSSANGVEQFAIVPMPSEARAPAGACPISATAPAEFRRLRECLPIILAVPQLNECR